MVHPKTRVSKVLMVGPLVSCTEDFTSTLKASGYAPLTVVNELRLMAHLSRWMQARELTVTALSSELLQEYEALVRASGLGWSAQAWLAQMLLEDRWSSSR